MEANYIIQSQNRDGDRVDVEESKLIDSLVELILRDGNESILYDGLKSILKEDLDGAVTSVQDKAVGYLNDEKLRDQI